MLSCCSLSYPHPYQCELDNYVPDEKFLEKAQLQVCQRGHRMSVTYVDDIYFAPVGERSIAISLSVCLCVHVSVSVSVCLSASISLELLDRSSQHFLCRSPLAVARSSSGGIMICYVVPVLWMWLLIGIGYWWCSTAHQAASKHTTAPTSHTRLSPRKHSPDGATPTEVADI